MQQWLTLFQKEMKELWRNRKWIWVPLVFMLLTSMDPLTYYFLPEIIELSGGLPEGAMMEFPTMGATEVIIASISQLSTFGIIIIALVSMGTIAGERKNGQSEMVLVRPISYTSYITAKWVAYLFLIWVSLCLSMMLSWYYINLLFEDLSFITLLQLIGFYGLWLSLVLTIAFFYHSIANSPGLVAACTIFTILFMSGINAAFGHLLPYFPNQLTAQIGNLLENGHVSTNLWIIASIILFIIFVCILLAINIFKKKEVVQP